MQQTGCEQYEAQFSLATHSGFLMHLIHVLMKGLGFSFPWGEAAVQWRVMKPH